RRRAPRRIARRRERGSRHRPDVCRRRRQFALRELPARARVPRRACDDAAYRRPSARHALDRPGLVRPRTRYPAALARHQPWSLLTPGARLSRPPDPEWVTVFGRLPTPPPGAALHDTRER